MTEASERSYLPAAGHDFFLPLYDGVTRLMGIGRTREALLTQAQLQSAQRVLDVGCGTGSLLVLLKQRYPNVDAVGVDPDPKALARARQKAEQSGVSVAFEQGFAGRLAYPEQHFDRVLSSFMFHHLKPSDRLPLLQGLLRVLKPGGRLELVDFAGPTPNGRRGWVSWLHSLEQLANNAEDQVLSLMSQAGFVTSHVTARQDLRLASVVFYQSTRPTGGAAA